MKNRFIFKKKNKFLSYKITKKHVFFIRRILQMNKTITIKSLYSKLLNNFINFNISISHFFRVVKDINFSLKKIKMQHLPATRYKKK